MKGKSIQSSTTNEIFYQDSIKTESRKPKSNNRQAGLQKMFKGSIERRVLHLTSPIISSLSMCLFYRYFHGFVSLSVSLHRSVNGIEKHPLFLKQSTGDVCLPENPIIDEKDLLMAEGCQLCLFIGSSSPIFNRSSSFPCGFQ